MKTTPRLSLFYKPTAPYMPISLHPIAPHPFHENPEFIQGKEQVRRPPRTVARVSTPPLVHPSRANGPPLNRRIGGVGENGDPLEHASWPLHVMFKKVRDEYHARKLFDGLPQRGS